MGRRALALVCGVTLLGVTGCTPPGGVAVEGRASQVTPPPSTQPLPSGTPPSADAVAVLRGDPELDPKIKDSLQPCEDGRYPIDDRYADLTGDSRPDLVVTLLSCWPDKRKGEPPADVLPVPAAAGYGYGYGYAAYVYDLETDPPTRLFGVEDSAVEVAAVKEDGRTLVVIRNRWEPRDDPCCPTGRLEVLYRWDGTKFVEEPR